MKLMRFNRTFMELKYGGTDKLAVTNGSFNRTFMELKCITLEQEQIPGLWF